eukprot:COSAG05_NODE_25663_length_194_cov_168.263158_2_plen_41_part_01
MIQYPVLYLGTSAPGDRDGPCGALLDRAEQFAGDASRRCGC